MSKEAHSNPLENVRRSILSVLAEALPEVVPGTRVVGGGPTREGFTCDVELPTGGSLSSHDFEAIERAMRGRLAQPPTAEPAAFKLLSLAALQHEGPEPRTRIHGAAFGSEEALDAYLTGREEARQRDHRVIGRRLRLFALDERVGPGLVLWTPAGTAIRSALERFISGELQRQGYQQVRTPHIGRLELFRTSGHYPYYRDSQYPPMLAPEALAALASPHASCAEIAHRLESADTEGYLLKPMNCPFHIALFDAEPRSYRDLPVRLAEFGTVYRFEQSGELAGMTRVRGFTVDDAHIFCTEEQAPDELRGCLELVHTVLHAVGLGAYRVRVGLQDPGSEKFAVESGSWTLAESLCLRAVEERSIPHTREPGEAAFYGPKIDFVVEDAIGREWQLGTVQVDTVLPERFGLSYTGPDGRPRRPLIIHRAPFGSLERFVAILIEHFEGSFPTWLAPEAVRVLSVSERAAAYASEVRAALDAAGVRAGLDASELRLEAKIRRAAGQHIPYLLVVGARETAQRSVSVRARAVQRDLGALPLEDCVAALQEEVATRGAASLAARLGTAPGPAHT